MAAELRVNVFALKDAMNHLMKFGYAYTFRICSFKIVSSAFWTGLCGESSARVKLNCFQLYIFSFSQQLVNLLVNGRQNIMIM